MSVITVIGSGQMGSSLSIPLLDNGHEVRLVGSPLDGEIIDGLRENNHHKTLMRDLPKTDKLKFYKIEELDSALPGTDLVVCGVSSFGVDWFGKEILPKIPKDIEILSVTKGMINEDDGNLTVYPDYWKREYDNDRDIYAIGGPCTARGLTDKEETFVAFCGVDVEKLKWIKSIFETPYYIINLTTDVVGLEAAVALKNGYALATAIGMGMAEKRDDGIKFINGISTLFQQSTKEMFELVEFMSCDLTNIMYAVGDLYVTVQAGRSRTVGLLLGKGLSIEEVKKELKGQTLEAIVIATRTADAVRKLSKKNILDQKDFPLLMHVDELLNKDAKLNVPWKDFEIIDDYKNK